MDIDYVLIAVLLCTNHNVVTTQALKLIKLGFKWSGFFIDCESR